MQVVLLAPVEYLTYEIRDVSDIERLVGANALVQPSGAPARYGCGTPLAGAVRPTVPKARGASFSHARAVGADDSVRPTAPQARNSFPDSPEMLFFTATLQLCLRRPYLFPLAGKDMEEKGAGDAK